MTSSIAEIDSLIEEIERLRNGSHEDNRKARHMAEKNRSIDPRIEALFQTFWLFSPEKGPAALASLQSHTGIPFVDARVGYYFTLNGRIDEGLALLQRAADAENKFAQHALAVMLYNGEGMPKDVPRAVEMLEALAAQGFLPSVYSLGAHYYKPPNEARGDVTGLNLIRRAAKAGYPAAIKNLPDLEKAAIMFGVAATSY